MTTSAGLDASRFALGSRTPAHAAAPRDVEELARVLRACDAERQAVVFFGGGTLQGSGHAPERYDVALSLARLDRILAYDPRDLTIGVEAGCTLAALERKLAEEGQFVPFDAPLPARATVGGTLAAGWLGPRRATYGPLRDFTIGTTVVLADGTVARAGGMVVKNATGYDLSKLYVGSLGTLAAIVRANFKTLPLPRARRIALAPLPERTRARTRARLAALDIEPAAALFVRGFASEIEGHDDADGRALVLLEGSERTVERATRELRSALGAAGVGETRLVDGEATALFARAIDAYVKPLGSRSATYRSSGSLADANARLDAFARVARTCSLKLETIEDARTGDIIARVSTRLVPELAERVLAFDAERRTALAEARVLVAPAAVRGRLDAWGAPPSSLPVMRALKARFDPHGTLAPGRFVGGL